MNNRINPYDPIFKDYELYRARMISGSKSGYRKRNPYNLVVFNARIYDSLEITAEPIWYGDLDINNDGQNLKKISEQIGKTLYVTFESGSNKNSQIVWDTTKAIPVVTPEYIEFAIAKDQEENRQSRISMIRRFRKVILKNKILPIVDLIDNGTYHNKILFPQKLLEKELDDFYKVVARFKRVPKRDSPRFQKYFKDHGYFSAYFLDSFLIETLDIQNGFMIDPSSIWISRKLNKKLRKVDLAIEKIFDINFNYNDFGRFVTCNYCVPYIDYLNEERINQDSYEDHYLYIRNNYKRESIQFINY